MLNDKKPVSEVVVFTCTIYEDRSCKIVRTEKLNSNLSELLMTKEEVSAFEKIINFIGQ